MIAAFLSLISYALSGHVFSRSDANLFGKYVQPLAAKLGVDLNTITPAYRETQIYLQFTIYLALTFAPLPNLFMLWGIPFHSAMVGFMATHWLFGWDWIYYLFNKENYLNYAEMDWFKPALPQLLSKLFRGHYISGEELQWIGPLAVVIGLIISLL